MPNFIFTGNPGDTIEITVGDTVDTLVDNNLHQNENGNPAIGCLITCESEDIRFTLGPSDNDPEQGNDALGHILYEDQSIKLTNGQQIQSFRFISRVNGSAATLNVTSEFEIGRSTTYIS